MISNVEVERFIELVQQARSTLPEILDESSVRETYAIEQSDVATCEGFHDLLWKIIREAVVCSSKKEFINLRLLKSALFRRSRFFADGTRYDAIPATILFGVNEQHFVSLSDSASWYKAIRAAFALDAVLECRPDWEDQRDVIVTDTARRWLQRGYRVRLDGQQFVFEADEEVRAANAVDNMARQIGGQRLIFTALTGLRDQGHFVNGRFSIPRSATSISVPRISGSLPYGYLLQLAVRHMRSTPSACSAKICASFSEYITDLVALLDVEAYSHWVQFFTDHALLPRYIQAFILSDFCLNLRQIRADDALYMLEHLFQWLPPETMREFHGWTLPEALKVARVCLKPGTPWPVNVIFQAEDICHATKLPAQLVDRILVSFTHHTDQLNAKFAKPTDAKECNFYRKPFIWQPGKKVLLTAPSLSAVGFIEAVLDAARAIDMNADGKTGLALESMLAESFRRQGIEPTAVSQKYSPNKKQHFDCDLLIETADTILLFEVKKKSLTNISMSGSVLDTLIDLSLAMVKAQTQLLHHEFQLTLEEGITFENEVQVQGHGRRVEKIAVTLLDWGTMQDRTVSDTILKHLAGTNISAVGVTDSQKQKLVECNKLLELVMKRAQQLTSPTSEGPLPFIDCTFLGVPQILFMLEGARSAEEFLARLRTFKHTSVATFDMYRGMRYMQNAHATNQTTPAD